MMKRFVCLLEAPRADVTFCGKFGHKATDCYKNPADKGNKSESDKVELWLKNKRHFCCKEMAHIANNCHKLKAKKWREREEANLFVEEEEEEELTMVAIALDDVKELTLSSVDGKKKGSSFIVADSGTSCHMSGFFEPNVRFETMC